MKCLTPFFCVLFGCFGTWVAAQEWQKLSGADIRAALTGKQFIYDTATQEFFASGKTLYNAGQESWGNWQVQGNRYCSQWPPRQEWVCYDIEASPGQIRFIGAGGDVTIGTETK